MVLVEVEVEACRLDVGSCKFVEYFQVLSHPGDGAGRDDHAVGQSVTIGSCGDVDVLELIVVVEDHDWALVEDGVPALKGTHAPNASMQVPELEPLETWRSASISRTETSRTIDYRFDLCVPQNSFESQERSINTTYFEHPFP